MDRIEQGDRDHLLAVNFCLLKGYLRKHLILSSSLSVAREMLRLPGNSGSGGDGVIEEDSALTRDKGNGRRLREIGGVRGRRVQNISIRRDGGIMA